MGARCHCGVDWTTVVCDSMARWFIVRGTLIMSGSGVKNLAKLQIVDTIPPGVCICPV